MTSWNWTGSTSNAMSISFGFRPYIDPDAPMLSHHGPVDFSTCTDLVPRPQICWDTNRYYRSLGVHWKATKKELMKAYQALGTMPDAYPTYAFKQLLDPVVRAEYDACPLGSLYNDKYVQEWLFRKAKMEMAKRGMDTTDEDLMRRTFARMGLDVEFDQPPQEPQNVSEDTPEGVVDDPGQEEQSERSAGETVTPRVYPWLYAYYLWRSTCNDTERLREWQEMLIAAFREKGLVTRIAVGYQGRSPHPWLTSRIGYRTVVFLHEGEQPSLAMAQAVADRVAQEQAA